MRLRPLLVSASLATGAAVAVAGSATALAPPRAIAPRSTVAAASPWSPPEFKDRYIVVLSPGADASTVDEVARFATKHGGRVSERYHAALRGFAARLPEDAAEALRQRDQVAFVEPEQAYQLTGEQVYPPDHLDRLDERLRPLDDVYHWNHSGRGVTAYVVDSGIRRTHVEFRGRVASGHTVVHDGHGIADCNGHGTFMSGVLAGKTFGVAKEATIAPVRVFRCTDYAGTSKILAGLDWIVRDHRDSPAVANLSFGGPPSDALDAAARRLTDDGVTPVIGGLSPIGCDGSPGGAADMLTVGYTFWESDFIDDLSPTSSCVDVYAPGSHIESASIEGDRWTVGGSGVSISAALTSGVVATYLEAHPRATPLRVVDAVLAAATPSKASGLAPDLAQPLLHSVDVGVALPAKAPTGELLEDVGFEHGGIGWTTRGAVTVTNQPGSAPATGSWSAHFLPAGKSELVQSGIRIPLQADVELSFRLRCESLEHGVGDDFALEITDGQHGGGSRLLYVNADDVGTSFVDYRFDVTAWAGQRVSLTFSDDMGDPNHEWYLDDVSLTAG